MLRLVHEMKSRDQRGFTLIELLIVIAIIAILAAIALPQFAAYRERGVRATMVSDARNLVSHVEGIFADCQTYPATTGNLTGSTVIPTSGIGICGAASPDIRVNISTNNTAVVTNVAATNSYSITVDNPNSGTGYTPVTLNGGGTAVFECRWNNGNGC